ncbi:hypothetical protein [Bacillus sp. HMF5848]|uniref:hypothetical protein n=1 Tax=Bacillus sp. HMF5848 TaxID=2495421 RepID=UPI0037BEE789
MCPLCNGFSTLQVTCSCGQVLEDHGRIIDYFDEYSAYMDIDGMKMVDGFVDTYKENLCAHLFYCSKCKKETIHLIHE